jgi:hypothetical protein
MQYRTNVASPPLSTNFFNEAFSIRNRRFAELTDNSQYGLLWSYIDELWKKKSIDLENGTFDLEEFLTLVDMQLAEAYERGEEGKVEKLNDIRYLLVKLFYNVLGEFKKDLYGCLEYTTDQSKIQHIIECNHFKKFGELLWKEKPLIITFNLTPLSRMR